MISMFKAPFKRKSVPLESATSTTPERTPRTKRSASASRSLTSLGSSSVNSLASQKLPCVSATNPDNVAVVLDNALLINENQVEEPVESSQDLDSLNGGPNTVEVDDNDAFPDELINNSKNNLLTISSTEDYIRTSIELHLERMTLEPAIDIPSSDDREMNSDLENKALDQSNKASMKVRLKKKIRNRVKGFGQQMKEQQGLENGSEVKSSKMKKYFSKINSFENDKLLSDDASSSKLNSPVHLIQTPITAEVCGTKRKTKEKKKKKATEIRSRPSDDNLHTEDRFNKGSKSLKSSIFSSFRNYSKASQVSDIGLETDSGKDFGSFTEISCTEESVKMVEQMEKLIESSRSIADASFEKSTKSGKAKRNLKSKFKFKLKKERGQELKKGKSCKTCLKKFRKIHPSHTVLDFKKDFRTDAIFESEFCSCTNSISIRNLNGDEDDFLDDDDLFNIKNHLYSDIDGVSNAVSRNGCTISSLY